MWPGVSRGQGCYAQGAAAVRARLAVLVGAAAGGARRGLGLAPGGRHALWAWTVTAAAAREFWSITWPYASTRGLVTGAAVWLGLGLIYLVLAMVTTSLLSDLASSAFVQKAVSDAPGDDVHAGLALRMIGDLGHPHVAVPVVGDSLAGLWPAWFAPSAAGSAWFGLVLPRDGSPVAWLVANSLVMAVLMAAGTAAHQLSSALPGGPSTLATRARLVRRLGLAAMAFAVVASLVGSPGEHSGLEMTWSMLATKALGVDSGGFDAAWPWLRFPLFLAHVTGVLAAAYVLGRLLTAAARRSLPWFGGAAGAAQSRESYRRTAAHMALFSAGFFVLSPLGVRVDVQMEALQAGNAILTNQPIAETLRGDRPSTVQIDHGRSGYVLMVNGRRRLLRGIGYNPSTAGTPPEERSERLQRDFTDIAGAGFNAILGWDEDEFDPALLLHAGEKGLGVVAPFELGPAADYSDPRVRSAVLKQIDVWVTQRKNIPSLWMWGLGNEVVHGIGDAKSPRAAAFASFLMEAADRVHQLDPQHPVVYRDAEDVYLQPVEEALRRGPRRSWFVYGMNFFSLRIGEALSRGPSTALDQPLIISEFGPAGVWAQGRPAAYLKQWAAIREHKARVLGGFVYVWCREGPEALDRMFGITDAAGQPADGSLAALSAVFNAEARANRAAAPIEADTSQETR